MSRTLPKLLILGSGWGSYSLLNSISKAAYRVVVVSPRNHFLFTPLLASTTVGTLEFRSIIEPIRNLGFRHSEDFHLASAETWLPDQKKLLCRSTLNPDSLFQLDYDKLVIGVGALPNTFGVPGVRENAFFLKEVKDAQAIRTRLLNNFELSLETPEEPDGEEPLLHTVIVGGGPTGVEFGAELYDFVRQDIARLYPEQRRKVRVTLVESNQILGSFDERLRTYAEAKLAQRRNFNLVKASVKEVRPNSVLLDDGTELPCGLVVWSTGLAPHTFTQNLQVQRNRAGQIETDEWLRILSDPTGDSFALGDCADIRNLPLPCTAQVAERQGRYLADALVLRAYGGGRSVAPFKFTSAGMLAYIGGYSALSDLPAAKLKGWHSWFLWRSAYLTRLGSWRLRMQVPLDWLKTLLFGRDTSRF